MLNMVKIKGCKKCGGDLFLEKDDDGSYISCLQCSAIYVRRQLPYLKRTRARKEYAHAR